MDSLITLIEKISFLRTELIKTSDAEKKFFLIKKIEELETEIEGFKKRLEEADKNQDEKAKIQIDKEIKRILGSDIEEILKLIYDLLKEQQEEKANKEEPKDKRDVVLYFPHKKTFFEKIGFQNKKLSYFNSLKPTDQNSQKEFEAKMKKYVGLLRENFLNRNELNFFKLQPTETNLIVLIADAGMGKTFLMQRVFWQYAIQNEYHLAFLYASYDLKDQIKQIKKQVEKLNIDKKKVILFIDALDEDSQIRKNPKKQIKKLYDQLLSYKHVVMSCRNQLFEDNQEFQNVIDTLDTKNQLISISKLDENQQEQFINNYFPSSKANQIKQFVRSRSDFKRPILLKYAGLILDKKIDTQFSFFIYEKITQSWAEKEAKNLDKYNFEKIAKDILKDAQKLAKQLLESNKNSFSAYELQTASKLKKDALAHSFFSRNGDDFSFIHQVFYEYFLAKLLFEKQITEEQVLQKFPKLNTEVWQFYIQMLCKEHIGLYLDLANMNKAREYERTKLTSRDYPSEEKCNLIDTLPQNLYARALTTKFLLSNKVVVEPNFWFWYPHWEKVPQEVKDIVENEEWKSYLEAEEVFYEAVWKDYDVEDKGYTIDGYGKEYNFSTIIKNIFKNPKILFLHKYFFDNLSISECEIKDLIFLENLSKSITSIVFSYNKIKDIDNIKRFGNLNYLNISNNLIENIEPIEDLINLEKLTIYSNQITNIEPIKNLNKLIDLNISKNRIENIDSVKNLNKLTRLDISDNQVINITSINNLINLHYLNISNNKITNIEKISTLKEIKMIDISNNPIEDMIPIKDLINLENLAISINEMELDIFKNLINLEQLSFSNSFIADITPIKNLTKLKSISINNSSVTNIDCFVNMPNLNSLYMIEMGLQDISFCSQLTNLRSLSVSKNRIKNIQCISQLNKLESLFIYSNNIDNIDALSNLSQLFNLHIGNNMIEDLSPLRNLKEIFQFWALNNQIEDLQPISKCISLCDLVLYNNKIKDITPLYNLENLAYVSLYGNEIPKEQIEELRRRLPNCDIIDVEPKKEEKPKN